MDVFYIVFGIILVAIMMIGSFMVGAVFMKTLYRSAQEEARYDAMRYEYYKMAGVQNMASPRPYVPPMPRTPLNRWVSPHMGALDRRLREGKRGVIMCRAGDRRK